MGLIALNALLCVLMLLCAAWAPGKDRRLAIEQAAVLTCAWLLYISAWLPNVAPSFMFYRLTGEKIDPVDIWAATDCAVGLWLFHRAWVRPRLWLLALFGLILAQTYIHFPYREGLIPFGFYNAALDVLWWGQVAVIVLLGGRHVVARVARAADRVRTRAFGKAFQ